MLPFILCLLTNCSCFSFSLVHFFHRRLTVTSHVYPDLDGCGIKTLPSICLCHVYLLATVKLENRVVFKSDDYQSKLGKEGKREHKLIFISGVSPSRPKPEKKILLENSD